MEVTTIKSGPIDHPERGPSPKSRLEHVDALRGIAALGVVVAHCGNAQPNLPVWLSRYAGAGGFGVQLFYIISAFTLLLSYEARRARESSPTRNFILRRLFRIAPMYYLAVALYASNDLLSHGYWTPNGVTWGAIVANLLLIHGWIPSYINGAVHGGWSVGVEFSFYTFFPLLAARLKNIWQCLFFFIVFAVIAGPGRLVLGSLTLRVLAPGANPLWIPFYYFWLPTQMPAFLLGFVAFYIVKGGIATRSTADSNPLIPLVLLLGGGGFWPECHSWNRIFSPCTCWRPQL